MFNIPKLDFVKTAASDAMSRVKDLPQTLQQKTTGMMSALPLDAQNLDARDLMARAANPSITGATGSVSKLSDKVSGYKINEYPENVGSDRYPHYVAFFINEYVLNGSPKDTRGGSGYKEDVVRNIDQYGMVGGGVGRNLQKGSKNFTQASSNLETTGAKEAEAAKQNGSATGELIGETKQVVGKALSEIGTTIKRTADVIILYTPNQIRQQYSAGYEQFSNASLLGSALIGAANANNVSDAMGVLGDSLQNVGSELARGVIGAAAKVGGMEGAIQAIDKAGGKIQNQRTEILFRSMDMRRHEFNYLFSPRNLNEAQKIEDIIRLFKLHMHPMVQTENDKTGNYLIMPSEFDIEFYYETGENTHLPKILTCVLENCSVDYTPQSMWSAFDGVPFPTHISLSLQFKELEPLTAQHIKEGF